MRKPIILLAALTAAAVAATGAAASTHHRQARTVVIKAVSGMKMVPNKYFADEMHFAPGTITVRSGDSITFEFAGKQTEPHTLTIVPRAQLPKTAEQAEQCAACRLATPHLKNPKAEPGPGNPIVHWVLDKGKPGLDTVGDSIAIQPGGPHKSITIQVSAKAGTTLYYLCAVHPWMQGKIIVR